MPFKKKRLNNSQKEYLNYLNKARGNYFRGRKYRTPPSYIRNLIVKGKGPTSTGTCPITQEDNVGLYTVCINNHQISASAIFGLYDNDIYTCPVCRAPLMFPPELANYLNIREKAKRIQARQAEDAQFGQRPQDDIHFDFNSAMAREEARAEERRARRREQERQREAEQARREAEQERQREAEYSRRREEAREAVRRERQREAAAEMERAARQQAVRPQRSQIQSSNSRHEPSCRLYNRQQEEERSLQQAISASKELQNQIRLEEYNLRKIRFREKFDKLQSEGMSLTAIMNVLGSELTREFEHASALWKDWDGVKPNSRHYDITKILGS